MSKGALILIVAALGSILAYHLLALSRDVSSDPSYARFVGKTLVTRKNLYLVRFGGTTVDSLGDAESISSALPHPPEAAAVSGIYGGAEVTRVVPAGTIIEITKVNKNVNTAAEFSGRILGEEEDIDLSFTQDYGGETGLLKGGFYNFDKL
jgi:hypothetical protein